MSKGTRKISVAVVTVSLAATTAFGVIKANNIYDDSTIGLSSALDRYVESVQLETASAGDGSTPTDASSETVKTETAKTETKKTSKRVPRKKKKQQKLRQRKQKRERQRKPVSIHSLKESVLQL